MKNKKISVVGLGYVGLPLAVEFAKKYPTVGYDINKSRINELSKANDITREVDTQILNDVSAHDLASLEKKGKGLFFSNSSDDIESSNFYIITVPTPVDKNKNPVLGPLLKASECVGKVLKEGDYVIYESTVYPGATEEECIPILEQVSGLRFNKDFFVGYSPERINPGDKERTVSKIIKVTSGSTPDAAQVINELYKSVISAGTHLAPTIKIAEAAKVIENSQRDINIAFMNELAKIFNLLNIDTQSVLEAASTKWNFLSFKPGLVGGHCIGVDPYYLAQKAQQAGYHPEIILSGRRINDNMGKYVASEVVKLMMNRSLTVHDSNILILGFTFKENCPDTRNTRVIDVYNELKSYKANVQVHDPCANKHEVFEEYGLQLIDYPRKKYHAIILAVSHKELLDKNYKQNLVENGVLYDVKGELNINIIDARL